MGHASLKNYKKFQKQFTTLLDLAKVRFDESIKDCKVCMVSKFNKLPFNTTRKRAEKQLKIIHSDLMSPISPPSYPKGYRL